MFSVAFLSCLALAPPTIFERSAKFTATKTHLDRHLETWGGDPKQSLETYNDLKNNIPKPLQRWFEWHAKQHGGSNILAFLLGYKSGVITKIYFYDSNTGLHRGKEMGYKTERKYVPVHYNNYWKVPIAFSDLFGDAPGDGRIRYDIQPDGTEVEQASHLTLQYTEWRVMDKYAQIKDLLASRKCNTSLFEEWYARHKRDRLTCLGIETASESVTIYHANDSYYDEATCEE